MGERSRKERNNQDPTCVSENGSSEAAGDLEELVKLAERRNHGGDGDPEKCEGLAAVLGQLGAMAAELRTTREQVTAAKNEIDRLRALDQVLESTSARCRELSEHFHEREVLQPVFACLIGIADRCRQQENRARRVLEQKGDTAHRAVLLALRSIVDARGADRVEVESVLANFGVEPFQHEGSAFDPKLQSCVGRTEADDPAPHGEIAERLRPGYRRNGRVIRPEYVTVYVVPQRPKQGDHT